MRGLSLFASIALCGACFSPSDDGDLTDGLGTSSGSGSESSTSATATGTPTASGTQGETATDATEGETGSSSAGTSDGDDVATMPLDTSTGHGSESTSSAGGCGDGVLDDLEECDGTEGCTPTCELEHFECHPVLQVGCPEGSQCNWDVFDDDFTCAAMGDVGYGGACTSMENLYCEPGHICSNAASLSNCASSACCTNFCDTDNGDADCFAPLSCVSFWQVGFGKAPGPGLDDVGICVIP
jgi:hypothetical protein